jgi:hypothetical protein
MSEKKLPQPPPGFIPFKWKTRHNKTQRDVVEQLCPVCGEVGTVWGGSDSFGWQDPRAQALYDANKDRWAAGEYSYDVLCEQIDGVMLKQHWSRWGTGECMKCHTKFWHDFVGHPWHYYYNPVSANVKHNYQASLF